MRYIYILGLCLMCGMAAYSAEEVSIEAFSVDKHYCRLENGTPVVRLSITTELTNKTTVTLIAPKVFRLTGYVLQTNKKDFKKRWRLGELALIGENIWLDPIPPSEFFDIIKPGQAVLRPGFVVAVALPERQGQEERPVSYTYNISATLNFGPVAEDKLPKYNEAWEKIGKLIVGSIQTDRMTVEISPPSEFPKCLGSSPLVIGQ